MSAAIAFLHLVKGHLRRAGADSSWKSVAACVGATKQTISNVLNHQHAASIETLGKWMNNARFGGEPLAAILVHEGVTRIMLRINDGGATTYDALRTSVKVSYEREGIVEFDCCDKRSAFPLEWGYGPCQVCGQKYDTAGRWVTKAGDVPTCENCNRKIASAAPHHEAGTCESCGWRWGVNIDGQPFRNNKPPGAR